MCQFLLFSCFTLLPPTRISPLLPRFSQELNRRVWADSSFSLLFSLRVVVFQFNKKPKKTATEQKRKKNDKAKEKEDKSKKKKK